MIKKFQRQDSTRLSKLGKRRKRIQTWRKPKGMHSKMRLKRKSYPKSPNIGYKTPKSPQLKLINNLKDLDSTNKDNILILSSKVGAKKKLDIIKKSKDLGLKITNVSRSSKWN